MMAGDSDAACFVRAWIRANIGAWRADDSARVVAELASATGLAPDAVCDVILDELAAWREARSVGALLERRAAMLASGVPASDPYVRTLELLALATPIGAASTAQ
jgi:hypothetical protein